MEVRNFSNASFTSVAILEGRLGCLQPGAGTTHGSYLDLCPHLKNGSGGSKNTIHIVFGLAKGKGSKGGALIT